MAVHVPIPFVFLMRIFSGISITVIPLAILSAIIGQIIGGKLRRKYASEK
jgi:hypothetical protein